MAFIGRLDGLTVPDILQILGLLRKTGKLTLTRLGSSGMILFRMGEMIFAHSDSVHDLLGTALIRENSLTETALKTALETQHFSPEWRRLGGILVEKGLSTPHVVSRAVQHQIERVLLEFLTWETGFFRFESMPIASEDELIQAGKDPQRLLHGEFFKNMYGEESWGEILQDCERRLEGVFSAQGGSESDR